MRKCGFTQSGRSVKKNMIKSFIPLPGCLDEDKEIFNDIFLARKLSQSLGAQGFFYLFFLWRKVFVAGFDHWVTHGRLRY